MNEQSLEDEMGISRQGMVPRKGTRLVPALLAGLALLIFLAYAIEWSKAASVLFSNDADAFEDFPGLIKRLKAPAEDDTLSKLVWDDFDQETQRKLASDHTPIQEKKTLVISGLNKILESSSLIDGIDSFSGKLEGYDFRVLDSPGDIPRKVEKGGLVIVDKSGKEWTFHVVTQDGAIDYTETTLSKRRPELARLKTALDSVREGQELQGKEKADYVRKVTHLLRYTGIGSTFDLIFKDYDRIKSTDAGAENRLILNRLLLDRNYQGQIAPVFGVTGLDLRFWAWAIKYSAQNVARDIPHVIEAQIKTVLILTLCSLIPGLAGLVFRRAFWMWFLGAFVTLFLINNMFVVWGFGGIAADLYTKVGEESYADYLAFEAFLILLMLRYSLRPHFASVIDPATKRNNVLGAVALMLAATGWAYGIRNQVESVFTISGVLQSSFVLMLLVVAGLLLRQTLRSRRGRPRKNIVVCLDGTWNQPGTTDFGYLAETNVFKLFRMLKGTRSREVYNASRCKEYLDGKQERQIAFYYHGVGNKVENSELGQFFGGAFGLGADAIVERAYLDVARVYGPGDRIFIFGFSRGAAIARLLAGLIRSRDIPMSFWYLRLFGKHWSIWKSSKRIDELNPVRVEVLGCWDTVGAFGISKNILGIPFQKINLLKDLTVSLCVKRAYHMVALDETRDSFEPTLMDPDPTTPNRVVEVWFSGNHSNVGGGYATDKLSDVTLDFLLRQVSSGYAWNDAMEPGKDESWGLYLNAARKGRRVADDAKAAALIDPDPRGQIRHATGPLYSHAPRELPIRAVIHDSVFDRMLDALPVYAPRSLFSLNEKMVKLRAEVETEVKNLVGTGSIEDAQFQRILALSNRHLSPMKWSSYLESELEDKSRLKEKLKPEQELLNCV